MRGLLAAIAVIVLVLSALPGQCIVYVKPGEGPPPPPPGREALGAGESWESAYNSIQAAIDDAATKPGGDEVWVAGGYYHECIELRYAVHVYGGFAGTEATRGERDISANKTIIDADLLGPAVTAEYTLDCTIDGFTIQNGRSDLGGGIYCYYGAPLISNNTITHNLASYGGGGIFCYRCEATIRDNTIVENSASFTGGGIYCRDSNYTTIRSCTITSNGAAGYGGGLGFLGSSPVVDSCVITGNSATGAGGAIYCRESSPTITNCLVTNSFGGYGGAVRCVDNSSPQIINCTICGNRADHAGVLMASEYSSPVFLNTILYGNNAQLGGGCAQKDPTSNPVFEYCCIRNNSSPQFLPQPAWNPIGTLGNIDSDPAFVSFDYITGDFHLQGNSPCIDHGQSAIPLFDLDGVGRPQDGDGDGTAVHDIGAYEYAQPQPVSIGIAKRDLPDGTLVFFEGAVVTACFPDLGGLCVESPDRSSSMAVVTDDILPPGAVVNVQGKMTADSGVAQRFVVATAPLAVTGSVAAPRPRAMTVRSLGGAAFGLQPGVTGGVGLNTIWMPVQIAGRVTAVDASQSHFYVDDGSGVLDGTEFSGGAPGVHVDYPPLDLSVGDNVVVTGISSVFRGSDGSVQRLIMGTGVATVFPAAPSFVFGGAPSSSEPNNIGIHFAPVIGASAYRLYQSADGSDWQFVSEIPRDQYFRGFELTVPVNTYFAIRAVGPGGVEGASSKRIHARVQDPRVQFSLTQPLLGQPGVSRKPTICWPTVPGAARMGVEVHAFPMWPNPAGPTEWGAILDHPWDNCAVYGHTEQALVYEQANSVLSPTTSYWLSVYAIDSENWKFASCQDWPFTTGP